MLTSLLAVAGFVIAVGSLMFASWQTFLLRRQTQFLADQTQLLNEQTRTANRIATLGAIYNGLERLQFVQDRMVDDPELRSYFYDGRALPEPTAPDYDRLLLIAELVADALDYGLIANHLIEGIEPFDGWTPYCQFMLDNSPALQQIVGRHPDWWPKLSSTWGQPSASGRAAERPAVAPPDPA